MSLNDTQFKADLKDVYDATYESTGDRDEALDVFLNALVPAVKAYMKSANIIYTGGLTAGSAPVIGVFEGRLE